MVKMGKLRMKKITPSFMDKIWYVLIPAGNSKDAKEHLKRSGYSGNVMSGKQIKEEIKKLGEK